MIAKFCYSFGSGVYLRYARTKNDTWPSSDHPLGRKGYWYGSGKLVTYLGNTKKIVVSKVGMCGLGVDGYKTDNTSTPWVKLP